ncbi:MAG TPA: CPBP family intramembrane glutamic endopeptidase [Planctomycetaceae bacterium]|jgi:membrane protease YdiL (CAAX protease family)|nr:CPBP family intramembrane glutamic endopeptidase [Planctomycetaceae bacterium]
MRDQRVRALVGFVWGILLFMGLAYALKAVLPAEVVGSPIRSQLVLKGSMVVLAFLGWALQRRPFGEMGWRRPVWSRSHLAWYGIGAAAMMAATVVLIFVGRKHPLVAQMSFPEIIVMIWFVSSFSEEIYVRGLVQSWTTRGEETLALSPFAPAILSSALVFAAMHVSLIWTPLGLKGAVPLIAATLVLGWVCAVLRARSRSLWPAIACHVLGNVAAIPGGILGVILFRVIYHRLPDIVTSG